MTLTDKEKQTILAALEHLRQTKLGLKNTPDQKPLNKYDIINYAHTQAMCISLLSKISGEPIANFAK